MPISPFLIAATLLLSLLILVARPVYGQSLYADKAHSLYAETRIRCVTPLTLRLRSPLMIRLPVESTPTTSAVTVPWSKSLWTV